MAAAVGTAFNWISVRSGTRTRISAGPLVTGLPWIALEMMATSFSTRTVSWTLQMYSAAPPWYQTLTGTNTLFVTTTLPTGHVADWSAVFGFAVTPWAEFYLTTNRPCFAHIAMF